MSERAPLPFADLPDSSTTPGSQFFASVVDLAALLDTEEPPQDLRLYWQPKATSALQAALEEAKHTDFESGRPADEEPGRPRVELVMVAEHLIAPEQGELRPGEPLLRLSFLHVQGEMTFTGVPLTPAALAARLGGAHG